MSRLILATIILIVLQIGAATQACISDSCIKTLGRYYTSGGFREVDKGAVAPPSCHLRKYKRMNVLA